MEKMAEDQRVSMVGPLNNTVSKINEYCKQVKAPILAALDHLKKEQVAFERILEAERAAQRAIEMEERRKREEEAQAKIKAQQEEAAAKIQALKEEAEALAMFDPTGAKEAEKEAEAAAEAVAAQARAEAERIEFETKKAGWDASKEIKSNKVSGVRRSYKAEIENEALVPREYLSVDQVKINAAVRSGAREIPGVRIFEDITITGR
jgi:hypothetical protein